MAAGSIVIDLMLRTGSLSTDTGRAEKALGQLKGQALSLAKTFGAGLFGIGSVAAFASMISSSIEAMARLRDLSIQTNISVEALSSLGKVAKYSNTSLDSIASASNKLSKALFTSDETGKGAAEAIAALGLNFNEFKALSPDQQMLEVAKSLNNFEDGASKSAIAMLLFGKAGAELLPFLKELAERGVVATKMTTDLANAAKEYEDNLITLKAAGDEWKKQLVSDLLPALVEVTNQLVDGRKAFGGYASAMFAIGLSNPFKTHAEQITSTREKLEEATLQLDRFNEAGKGKPGLFDASISAEKAKIEDLQKMLKYLNAQQARDALELGKGVGQDPALRQDTRNLNKQLAAIKAAEEIRKAIDSSATSQQKMNRELEDTKHNYDAIRAANPASPLLAGEQSTLAAIRAKYAEKPIAVRDDAATKMIEHLKEQGAILKEQLTVQTPLLEAEKERAKFEAMIAGLKGKVLTEDQKSLLAAHDKIKAQLDSNVVLAQSVEFEKKIAEIQKKSDEDRKRFIESTAALNATMEAGTAGRKEQYDDRLQVFGKGSQALEELKSRQAITKEYAKYQLDLKKAASETDSLGSAEYKTELDTIRSSLAGALQANADYYDALKAKQGDWRNGAIQALQDYADNARDIASQTEGLFTHAFQGMEDALVSFAQTGKLNFKSLVDSIISDLLRMMIKAQITGPLAQALGGALGGGGSTLGGQGNTGANAGNNWGLGPASASGGGYTKMASGGIVPYDGFKASLHAGERVVPKGQSMGSKIEIHNYGASVETQKATGSDGSDITRLIVRIKQEVANDIRGGGGDVATAMKSRGVSLSGGLPRRS